MPNHVLKINNDNSNVEEHIKIFNENKNKGNWFVKYYANWCPHCTSMQSQWNQLENHEVLKSKNINIAEIEESHFGQLSSKPDVVGFPTIKYYVNGESQDFQEARTTEGMSSFLQKQSGGSRKLKTLRNKKRNRINKSIKKRKQSSGKRKNSIKKGGCSGCFHFGGGKKKNKSMKKRKQQRKK